MERLQVSFGNMVMIQEEIGLVKPQWICQIYEQSFCSISSHVAFTLFFRRKRNRKIFRPHLYVIVFLGVCICSMTIEFYFGDS